MTRFIEYVDKRGDRSLVSLNLVESITDKNKSVIISFKGERVTLAISYETFKAWISEGDKSPILAAGNAL